MLWILANQEVPANEPLDEPQAPSSRDARNTNAKKPQKKQNQKHRAMLIK
jgi:hypothetical protein